jgi:hypothetical protein
LQEQLFRVVFGREPGAGDPNLWDQSREQEGAFVLDPRAVRHRLAESLTKVDGIRGRPEAEYAIEDLEAMLEAWHDAVSEYSHQAATGVVPLAPPEFFRAWTAVDETGRGGGDPRRLLGALQNAVGTEAKAQAADILMTALFEIVGHDELPHLVSSEGYMEPAVLAAASAEINRNTGRFDIDSFRARLAREGLATREPS